MKGTRMTSGLLALALSAIICIGYVSANIQDDSEYQQHVKFNGEKGAAETIIIKKPMFPIRFNDGQIPIGSHCKVACPLEANKSYHIYLYGSWVNLGSDPKTDYDIFVYNPLGELECHSTNAAGIPESIVTPGLEPYFVPKHSGEYIFVIANDAKESHGSEGATFMIIEHIECNKWYQHYVEGKNNTGYPSFRTSWAYEFVTNSSRIEIWIEVPETLDMYEARLYLMTNPKAKNKTIVGGIPLPWEPGLYGEVKDVIGGFNLESKGYRGIAYTSCGDYGKDMLINFTLPKELRTEEPITYHLVFIGESGRGAIKFLVKTKFGGSELKPLKIPTQVYPNTEISISYISTPFNLKNASLIYSTNNWKTTNKTEMEIIGNNTCQGIIPGQAVGTEVRYRVEAIDVLMNKMVAEGSYIVKHASAINLTSVPEKVTVGGKIIINGFLTPKISGQTITFTFKMQDEVNQIECKTDENGFFTANFTLKEPGYLILEAKYAGNGQIHGCSYGPFIIRVEEPPLITKIIPYIGVAAPLSIVGLFILYIVKMRG